MAIINDVMCKQLEGQLDLVLTTLDSITSGINLAYKNLKLVSKYLSTITIASPEQDVINAMNNLSNDINSKVPVGIGAEVDALLTMMQSCNLLDDALNDFGIDGISLGVTTSMFDDINNVIDLALDTLTNLAEYPAAVAIQKFDEYLSKLKIKDLMDMVDKLVVCFDSVCASNDYSIKINQFYNALDQLNINNFGKLDVNKFYTDIGVSLNDVKTNVQISYNSIVDAKESAQASINSELSNLKIAFGF